MKSVGKVFWISVVLSGIFVMIGVLFPESFSEAMNEANTFILQIFGWFYQLAATFFLLFALFLIFSKYGKIRLGKNEDRPEYSTLTWFAMLFSAGMGIGLVFYGVAEPISHFAEPPYGEGGTVASAKLALRYTFLHWGFHAWAIYATIALSIAYFKFRKGAPGLMSATLSPIFGDKTKGTLGNIVDIVAVFATVFGVCASLGLGAQQINGGLNFLFGIPNTFLIQLSIMAVVTVLFIISAGTGLSKGIRYLSNANMIIATILLFLFLLIGPTTFLLNLFTTTLGEYVQHLPSMGLRLSPFNKEDAEWIQGWTIFYWAWWISWSPFVGSFIARVSKGRTVRQFVIAVLLVPSLVCAFWFCIFGGTGIHLELYQGAEVSSQSFETALFYVYKLLPYGTLLSFITILLIATFFITSADSATFVLGMQTTNGNLNPPFFVKLIWGLILAASAVVLMYSGGLEGLQTAIIVSAFPLTFVLILMAFAIVKAFRVEMKGKVKESRK
ncbi:Glycine betaine transporter OpuD [Bacillus sp. THAF10]|uniref:glycine betaine uptake BCCT transporter n=1 Tax=Bacillus sp. THAF10 TaxID=2587848 RepID=UPI001268EC7B|nr:BCCT family transporter [Bacillus sp. THAF10]QFT89753.1 Glycine betaine transporter OpuD [Bacillus sp. THAF10]